MNSDSVEYSIKVGKSSSNPYNTQTNLQSKTIVMYVQLDYTIVPTVETLYCEQKFAIHVWISTLEIQTRIVGHIVDQ